MKDFTGMKVTEIRKEVRKTLTQELMEFLSQKYTTVAISEQEIGVVVGTLVDEDGFTQEIPATVKIISKSWYDKPKTSDKGRDVKRFDMYEEAEAFKQEQEMKKQKKGVKE